MNIKLTGNEYNYITLPNNKEITIKKVLFLLANYGRNILEDCNSVCSTKAQILLDVFNTLHIASYSYSLQETSKTDELFDYINSIININYINKETKTVVEDYNIIIPEVYLKSYQELLLTIEKYNNIIYKNSNLICNDLNKYITKLILVFNSAIANFNIKNYKLANLLIYYFNKEVKNNDKIETHIVNGNIDNDKHFIAGYNTNGVHFHINYDTGKLIGEGIDKNKYYINNNNLTYGRNTD